VKGLFHCVPLELQLLRGMTRTIQPYLVLGEPEPATPPPNAPGESAADGVAT
jgi:hypothetical protein